MNQIADAHLFPIFMFLSVGAIALFSFLAVASWSDARRREREAYYRSETLKKIAENQGVGGNAALEFLHEDEKNAARRRREGIKLGGLITLAVGIGFMIFLKADEPGDLDYLIGLVPSLIGASLLAYAYFLVPKD